MHFSLLESIFIDLFTDNVLVILTNKLVSSASAFELSIPLTVINKPVVDVRFPPWFGRLGEVPGVSSECWLSAYRTARSSHLISSRDGVTERINVSLSALGVSSVHQRVSAEYTCGRVSTPPIPLVCARQYSRRPPTAY